MSKFSGVISGPAFALIKSIPLKGGQNMLTASLLFSLVILVSFDTLSTALVATSAWAALSFILFNTSVL